MAELGGAFLSAFLQVFLDRLASREVIEFIKGRKLSTELLDKLETTMNTVSGLLDDAEELQITKPAVEVWLNKLKHVVYDADDLMDEIAYESLRSKFEPRKHKVHKFFSSRNPFRESMDGKVEKILGRLQHLVQQKDALGLKEGIGENPSSHKEPTSSLVDESGVFGRDKDRETIMELLLSDDPNGTNVAVIPIVGMGGLGKTTLAQLLYNDSRVKEQFALRAWICVSEKFDVLKMLIDILEEVTGKKCDSTATNQIEIQLQEKLKENKFFLVLDDIWEENYDNWVRLSTPLISGARGSKIIVTTRNETVASVMGTTPSHHLKELSAEDCWSLFAKHAFGDGNSAAHPHLEVIGREIVRKCGGLPLAAKTLGGLFRSKRDADEWKKISKSSFWDLPNSNILPALRLSYHYLPSHLKRCFAYCAIFPKDYLFMKEELVCLWMAEGFLIQPKGNKKILDVGEEYIQDLISRSFFQQSSGNNSFFIMHDLMHDLAEIVSGELCCRLEGDDLCSISRRGRHLSQCNLKLKGTFKGQLLRTFLLFKKRWMFAKIDDKVMIDLLSSLECVRALSLPGCHNLKEVPHSIGSLKHLRYLNLSGASIIRLPESVSSLYNLQTLTLFKCENLIELPSKMGRLINLFSLDTRKTRLQTMPPEMGNLTELRVLTHFIIGKENRSSIKELGKLKHIQGELSVQNLENVGDVEDVVEANMMVREQLKKLEFKWAGQIENSDFVVKVLEMLQPHANLECLYIIGYGGARFPTWVGDFSFSNLISLRLNECKSCSQLPPLGQLSSLKDLSITAFDSLMSVGPEFYGSCTSMPFGSLEILLLERMPHWHDWKDEPGAFPLLRELYVRECPSLEGTLPNHLPSLTVLEIEGCSQLVPTFPRASIGFQMKVKDNCRQVTLNTSSSGLRSLRVGKFHSAESLPKALKQSDGLCTSLKVIEITDSSSLKCFPLASFPDLESLLISKCPNLESLKAIEEMAIDQSGSSLASRETLKQENGLYASLEYVEITDCSYLKCFPSGFFPKLRTLYIKGCPSLESLNANEESAIDQSSSSSARKECNNLPVIRELSIIECPRLMLASLPWAPTIHKMEFRDLSGSIMLSKLPSGLHCLEIDGLISTEEIELEHLYGIFNSLEEIKIKDNNVLKCFPVELFPKLERFNISGCPNLDSYSSLKTTPGDLFFLSSFEIKKCPNMISVPTEAAAAAPSSHIILHFSRRINALVVYGPSSPATNGMLLKDDCRASLPKLPSGFYQLIVHDSCLYPNWGVEKTIGVSAASFKEIEITNLNSLSCFSLELFPNLQRITIKRCQNFESLCGYSMSLTSLQISDCKSIISFPGGLRAFSLTMLNLWGCSNFELLPDGMNSMFPALMELQVGACPKLRLFPEEGLPLRLEVLSIQELSNLESLAAKVLQHLTSLRRLSIRDCPKLLYWPACMQSLLPSLLHLKISSCPKLDTFLNGGLPSKLESLHISGCSKLIADLMKQGLQMMSSLSAFQLGEYEGVESFPSETFLPSGISSLGIYNLQNLKSLNYEGLQCLSSLTILTIYDCPMLQSLPAEGLPSSVYELSIIGCPLLQKRCQKENEEWSKIAHIPHIYL